MREATWEKWDRVYLGLKVIWKSEGWVQNERN